MIGNTVHLDGVPFTVVSLLGRGKAAYSYLIENGGKQYVYKKMHDEKVEHFTFGNKLLAEVEAYEKISAAGVAVPALISFSDKDQYLIKEYIEGPTAAELAVAGLLTDAHFALAYAMHLRFKVHGLHVDYFPTNFIFAHGTVYYIDYECHPYNAEWDFVNWGIYFWFNREGLRERLENGHTDLLNLPDSPKPVTAPFEAARRRVLLSLGEGIS